ncbi:hypothetical protein F4779DRAFT_569971 [Xylariaceae sp. FL0662B]|nr:hypothetical protein F4779DRAFT_569971 [Xylariaceae sp. FL0662B]
MSDLGNAVIQAAVDDGSRAPINAENAFLAPSQAPPECHDQTSTPIGTASPPYRPFPSTMNVYYQWNLKGMKFCHLCGARKDEPLYTIEYHYGYSMKMPLQTRPGLLLHNGTDAKDPVLAAVGDESQFSSKLYAFNLNSVVFLPPLSPRANTQGMVTEMMRATTTSGDPGVAFVFFVEVGHGEKMQREQFEWRKIKNGSDTEAEEGGFRLVRLPLGSQQAQPSSSSEEVLCSPPDDIKCEVVALLAWKKPWTRTLSHPFSLSLTGSARDGALGARGTLMIVMTALRLLMLDARGKTKRSIVAAAEKIRGKGPE